MTKRTIKVEIDPKGAEAGAAKVMASLQRLSAMANSSVTAIQKLSSGVSDAFMQMTRNAAESTLKLQQSFSDNLKTMRRSWQRFYTRLTKKPLAQWFGRQVQSIGRSFGSLGAMLARTAGIAALMKSIVSANNIFTTFHATMDVVTHSAARTAEEWEFVTSTANRLGVSIEGLATPYARLAAALQAVDRSGEVTRTIFEGISTAAVVLHKSTYDTNLMFLAMEQMASKGKVSLEELQKQLAQKLPGAMFMAARSMKMSTAEFHEAIERGKISVVDLMGNLGREIIKVYGSSVAYASQQFVASMNKMKNAFLQMGVKISQGGFMEGLNSIIKTLTSKLTGPELDAAYLHISRSFQDLFMSINSWIASISAEDVVSAFDALGIVVKAVQQSMSILIGSTDSISDGSLGDAFLTFAEVAGTAMISIATAIQTAILTIQSFSATGLDDVTSGFQNRFRGLGLAAITELRETLGNPRAMTGIYKSLTDGLSEASTEADGIHLKINALMKQSAEAINTLADGIANARKTLKEDHGHGGGAIADPKELVPDFTAPLNQIAEAQAKINKVYEEAGLDRIQMLELQKKRELQVLSTIQLPQLTDKMKVDDPDRYNAVKDLQKQLEQLRHQTVAAYDKQIKQIADKEKIAADKKADRERKQLQRSMDQFKLASLADEDRIMAKMDMDVRALQEERIRLEGHNQDKEMLQRQYEDAAMLRRQEAAEELQRMYEEQDAKELERIQKHEQAKLGIQTAFSDVFRSDRLVNLEQLSKDMLTFYKTSKKWDEMNNNDKLSMAKSFFGTFSGMMDSSNRKMFEMGKAAAVSEAIVSGILAVQNALSVKPVWLGLAMAGTVGAMTAMNVQKIISTQFKGGGGGGLSASTSSPSVAPVNVTPIPFDPVIQRPTTPGTTGAGQSGPQIVIHQQIDAAGAGIGAADAIQQAADLGARQAVQAVGQDFQTNGPLRQALAG